MNIDISDNAPDETETTEENMPAEETAEPSDDTSGETTEVAEVTEEEKPAPGPDIAAKLDQLIDMVTALDGAVRAVTGTFAAASVANGVVIRDDDAPEETMPAGISEEPDNPYERDYTLD